MTAQGKINASNVQVNDRIIVKNGQVSGTKTGEGVEIVRVLDKTFRPAGRFESRGRYVITTSAGSFEAAPIQTMFLAPEDAAGIKRAHVEALELDVIRNRENADRVLAKLDKTYSVSEEEAEDAYFEVKAQENEAARLTDAFLTRHEGLAFREGLALDEDEAHEEDKERNLHFNLYAAASFKEQHDYRNVVVTVNCPNAWHRSAPARARVLCQDCLTAAHLEADKEAVLRDEIARLQVTTWAAMHGTTYDNVINAFGIFRGMRFHQARLRDWDQAIQTNRLEREVRKIQREMWMLTRPEALEIALNRAHLAADLEATDRLLAEVAPEYNAADALRSTLTHAGYRVERKDEGTGNGPLHVLYGTTGGRIGSFVRASEAWAAAAQLILARGL
jgi:hypothetical protein